MALAIGSQLGPYEVGAAIGAGGMGEVYRARDLRLGRTVAIKILPEGELASDEMQRRFRREAQVIAGLTHPHICIIHDIGEEEGLQYIVMEYLEGETLFTRLERGPLQASQVLQYGIQIADALEKAHRARIIHRDLKPGNIMLTKSGVKLLDFGLARITHSAATPPLSAMTALPTEDCDITGRGIIVGTAQYMAPEQLEAKETDTRTDIFAFGAVLYEMATGQRAFRGKSQASLIAAILASEPKPLMEVNPLTPPALDRVVRACLAKDPGERWQTAHDVRLQLEWIQEAGSKAGVPPATARQRVNRERIIGAAAAVLLVMAVALGIGYLRKSPAPPPEVRFTIDSEPERTLTYLTPLALSPDGQQLAYGALDDKGKSALWVRRMDSFEAVRLEGSEDIDLNQLFLFTWTPDSHSVLATLKGKLLRFSAAGGAPETLCPVSGYPTSVNQDGAILISAAIFIARVSAADCKPKAVAQEAGAGYDYGLSWPQLLPDGEHVLLSGRRGNKQHDILLGAVESPTAEVVVRNGTFPKYVEPGFILFSRNGYLMAQRFDARMLRASGEPMLVSKRQMVFANLGGWADFDASPSGTVVWKEQYQPSNAIRWYSRSGQPQNLAADAGSFSEVRLAPDGRKVLASHENPRVHTSDVWSLDLEHGGWRRETVRENPGYTPTAWSPDGRRFIYSSLTDKRSELYLKEVGSSGDGTLLETGLRGYKMIGDWSRDGKFIVFSFSTVAELKIDVYGQSLEEPSKPFLLAEGGVEGDFPRLSGDGHWVAYVAKTAGEPEVYVRRFTDKPASSVQVSTAGGHCPRWSADGKQLFYLTDDWKLMSVTVRGTEQVEIGKPTVVFQLPHNAEYEVSKDNRFLVTAPAGRMVSPINVMLNWRPEPTKTD